MLDATLPAGLAAGLGQPGEFELDLGTQIGKLTAGD